MTLNGETRMKILLITDEVWNDNIHGNNIPSNLFAGLPDEFAQIYCSPGIPQNSCCKAYCQLTDIMMVKSIFNKHSAGKVFELKSQSTNTNLIEEENKNLYSFLKSITTETMRLVRDERWMFGKYNEELIKNFVNTFNPDVVFCPRMASRKLLRIERFVASVTEAPIIAFSGDDEYTLQQISMSPVYWLRRWLLRRDFRKTASIYSLYYTHSTEQGRLYEELFGLNTKRLYKCGEFEKEKVHLSINRPIKIVYAGKLYCNRWKTLGYIGDALKDINKDKVKMVLDIYTTDKLTNRQKKRLHDGKNIFVKGAVKPIELEKIYEKSDIALHVESFDKRNSLKTKFSFSTKIIDCLASGCAVMAICPEKQTGYQYLKEKKAAFVASDKKEIGVLLENIIDHPKIITEYAQRAYKSGLKYHQKEEVQKVFMNDLKDVENRNIKTNWEM